MTAAHDRAGGQVAVEPQLLLLLLGRGCGFCAVEAGEAVVYHPFANPRELHMEGDEPGEGVDGALCFPLGLAPALEAALGSAHGAELSTLEAAQLCQDEADEEDVLAALQALVDAGVLKTVDDDSESE